MEQFQKLELINDFKKFILEWILKVLEILPQLLVNAAISGSLYALMSSGLALTYGLLKILNFAHGHMMMFGAYLLLYFLNTQQYSFGVSMICVFVCITGFSMLVYNFFIRPFGKYELILTLVTTIALSNILESVISMWFGVNVQSFPSSFGFDSYEYFGIFITKVQLIIIFSALIGLSALAFLIHSTPFGRTIRALSEDPYAAQSIGISRQKNTYIVFILGIMLAAYAGIMLGYETNLSPTMGGAFTIKCFAAMVLGGLGNVWGTVAGSFILGLLENLVVGLDFNGFSIPAGYKDAVSFLIILIVLLFCPQGLFNRKKRAI
jgi:branched-chain amino acid transport system permease protein